MRNEGRNHLLWFSLETLLWFFPGCVFIFVFLFKYEGGTEGALLHFEVLGILLLLVTCLRCMFHRWMYIRFAEFLGAIVYSASMVLLVAYYVAALIGLDGWGRLISWALVVAYVNQADYLLESLGLRVDFFYGAVFFVFFGVVVSLHLTFLRRDGIRFFVERVPRRLFVGLILAVGVTGGAFFWRFKEFPMAEKGEPFSLMFYPEQIGNKFQSHFKFQSKSTNDAEDLARKNYSPRALSHPANVIFIVVDALRADHLSVNGYPRETTPYLQSVVSSRNWVNFGKIHSVCSESACGLMALANSRNMHMFPESPITVQELLRLHGYGVHMVLGGDHTNFYGLRKAYGVTDSYFDASMGISGYVNDDAAVVGRLKEFPSFDGKPVFIQFHLMSAHGLGTRENGLAPFQPSRSYYGDIGGRALLKGGSRSLEYVNYYDNGVHGADQKIKILMDLLRSKGYLENAIVVVTADHGEYVGEAGAYGHAKGVGEPVLGIPFLVGRYGAAIELDGFKGGAISQIDIAPTVLYELGIDVPTTWMGTPVQVRGRQFAYFQQNRAYGLIERKSDGSMWKYWVDAGTGQDYAYQISSDPDELSNRSSQVDSSEKIQWRRRLIDLEINARQSTDSAH